MNKVNTISRLCDLTAKVAEFYDWTKQADCFCEVSVFEHMSTHDDIIAFIETAVKEKIERERDDPFHVRM